MGLALAQAEQALFLTSPNPRVGCVLVAQDGQILGQGHTQPPGQAHAEVMAIRDAHARGHLSNGQLPIGTTAYVTLEPCCHQGRTGPCSQALIQSGIAKVVASSEDPNPQVCGKGFAALRAAGISVEVGDGARQAHELNIGFFKRHSKNLGHGLPWVRMKVASSLDGITALSNGESQWITGEPARRDTHFWRARACAVLTGIGTALADNPHLNVRHVSTERQPTLVLIDRQLQIPHQSNLFLTSRKTLIYTSISFEKKELSDKVKVFNAMGIEVISLPNSAGKVSLEGVMSDLGRRQINEVHVEAGFKLNGSLWREKLVDELLLYLNPRLLGQGLGIADIGAIHSLHQAPSLYIHDVHLVGEDIRVVARKV